MTNQVVSTILDVIHEFAYTLVFIAAAVVSYLALQRPRVKQWLGSADGLVRGVVFVALLALLYQPLSYVVSDAFALPEALIEGYPAYYPGARCCTGVLILAAMVAGIVLLVRETGQDKEEA